MSSESGTRTGIRLPVRCWGRWPARGLLMATVLALAPAQASEPVPDWRACSQQLAEAAQTSLAVESRRACIIAIAGTYLQWAGGELAAEVLPLSDDFRRRRLGTSREDASTDREALLADQRPELIASVNAQEWFVDGDTAWAIFTVTLKAQPDSTHWIAERFTVSQGKISDIVALPSVIKP